MTNTVPASRDLCFLADSTAIEPLGNHWCVWADTIAPVPGSLHLLNYQLKLLESYLAAPDAHELACQDVNLIGGPYIDIPEACADAVRQFYERTVALEKDRLALARAIRTVYEWLGQEAKGQGMDELYARLPPELAGYVELVYDYHNHPMLRFLDGLLYKSPYYTERTQHFCLFPQMRDDERRFFLTTPRLPQVRQGLYWQRPFDSLDVDTLARLSGTPKPFGEIQELLGVADADRRQLASLVATAGPTATGAEWRDPRVRCRYFNHACVLLQRDGVSIMTDPWIPIRSVAGGEPRFSYDDLPAFIDYALVTHAHHDHFVVESLLRLRHRIGTLVVPKASGVFYADTSLKLVAQRLGFKHVVEVQELDSIPLDDGEIIAIPFLGEHADLPHAKSAYVVRFGKESVYFGADSNCLAPAMYSHVRRAVGDVATVFIGMECVGAPLSWMYGAMMPVRLPREIDRTRRTKGCDADAALRIVETLGATRVYIYALGREPWLQYAMGLGADDEAPQIKQSNVALADAVRRGCVDAQRPFGQLELLLS